MIFWEQKRQKKRVEGEELGYLHTSRADGRGRPQGELYWLRARVFG